MVLQHNKATHSRTSSAKRSKSSLSTWETRLKLTSLKNQLRPFLQHKHYEREWGCVILQVQHVRCIHSLKYIKRWYQWLSGARDFDANSFGFASRTVVDALAGVEAGAGRLHWIHPQSENQRQTHDTPHDANSTETKPLVVFTQVDILLSTSHSDAASQHLSCLVLLLRKRLLGLDTCSLNPELTICYNPHVVNSPSPELSISWTYHLLNSSSPELLFVNLPSTELPISCTPHLFNSPYRELPIS